MTPPRWVDRPGVPQERIDDLAEERVAKKRDVDPDFAERDYERHLDRMWGDR